MNINRPPVQMYIVLLLLPMLIPIYHSYDDQHNKIYIYGIIAAIIGFALTITAFKQPDHFIKLSTLDITILAIVLYVVINQLIFGQYFDLQIMSRVVAGAIVFLFFKNLGKQEGKVAQFIDVFLILGIIEVLFVLAETLKLFSFSPDSVHSINGTFANPNVVAIFLAILIPLSFYRFYTSSRNKYLYLIYSLLFIIVIVLSKCRSAIVLSFFAIITYAIRSIPKWNLKKLLLIFALIVGLISVFVFVNVQKKDSNVSRMLIWKVSVDMIKEKPFTGFGLSSFEKEYNLYQSKYLGKKDVSREEILTAGYIRQPYNEFLYCWLTGGFIYFALYLTLWGLSGYHLIKSFHKSSNLLKFTSAVTLTGLLLISTFTYTFYLTIIEFFFMSIRLFTQAILCRQLQLTDRLETTVKGFSHSALG
ncbi:MAG: O-antigen ligase family protein [Bacteroidota bacterium]|nr:O-antigen ligase family protein [Bacteroidota bacterium]